MLKRPGWQRYCDDESVHRYSVRIIDQCDVTITSGSHIDDVTIAKPLTFEIISGAARNERYDFLLSKTTWRFNYKWAVVFCNGEYHRRLNSRPWWQIFQVRNRKNLWSLESFGKWRHNKLTRATCTAKMSLIPSALPNVLLVLTCRWIFGIVKILKTKWCYGTWGNNQYRNLQAEIYFEVTSFCIARDQRQYRKFASYAPCSWS